MFEKNSTRSSSIGAAAGEPLRDRFRGALIGALTGSLAGAYHGINSFPNRWLDPLENTGKGRDYVISLADRLWNSISL